MHKALFVPLQLSLGTFVCLSTRPLLAQITSDSTVNTQVNQNGNVAEITGGETRGSNLFHSFQGFSVQTGNEAFFNNANSISNIFSRVTGGNISNIDGLIRANGDASLFLINPAGIIFGENARLDIGGSFYGSSASSILFEDGEFSAVGNLQEPILTINAPIGLGFRDQPGDIVNNSLANNGKGLTVNQGKTVSLLGGDIRFNGGIVTAPGGIVNLGGLSSAGIIAIEQNDSLVFPEDVTKADVVFSDRAIIDLTSDGGGLITVNANNFELTGDSVLRTSIGAGMGSPGAVAGSIQIDTNILNLMSGSAIVASTFGRGDAGTVDITAQDVVIDKEWSGIYGTVGVKRIETEEQVFDAVGNGGTINVNTNNLSLNDGGRINVSSIAQGNAGNVEINATGDISFIGQGTTPVPAFGNGPVISSVLSIVRAGAIGESGDITLKGDSLTLIDKGALITNNDGQNGDAGNITIDINNKIVLDQEGLILSQVTSEDLARNAGDINIKTGSFEATTSLGANPTFIGTDNRGAGDGGNITIEANNNISLDEGTLIFTENGGDIIFTAGELNLANGSQLNANTDIPRTNTEDSNASGDIRIDVEGDINLDNGTLILTQLENAGVGKAGDININAGGSIFSTNGNLILADSKGQGDAGNITITAGEQIVLEGFPSGGFPSQIVSGLGDNAVGRSGGNIVINARDLILNDLAYIAANSNPESIGQAGNITVNVNNLRLAENSFINVFTGNDSNAGKITINAQTVDLLSGGKVVASTSGQGDAGDIEFKVSDQVNINSELQPSARFVNYDSSNSEILNDLQNQPSGVYTNATVEATGSGGNIFINSNSLTLNEGIISSSTNAGGGGEINLQIEENINLQNNSLISAQAFNSGNGGNVTINSNFIIASPIDNNDILASAEQGEGGKININVESLFGIRERALNPQTNDINASSEFSLDGTVNINILSFDPVQGATELSQNIVEPQETTAQACQSDRNIAASNQLTIQGKAGTIADPAQPLDSMGIIVDGEINNFNALIPAPIATSQGKIQPARGIKVTESGEVILTAYRTDNAGNRLPTIASSCGKSD